MAISLQFSKNPRQVEDFSLIMALSLELIKQMKKEVRKDRPMKLEIRTLILITRLPMPMILPRMLTLISTSSLRMGEN